MAQHECIWLDAGITELLSLPMDVSIPASNVSHVAEPMSIIQCPRIHGRPIPVSLAVLA